MSTWSDNPIHTTGADQLDRAKVVEAMQAVLTGDGLATPLVIGVYGGCDRRHRRIVDVILQAGLRKGMVPKGDIRRVHEEGPKDWKRG